MKKIGKFITEHSLLIVIISLVLLIPAMIGFISTKTNYDILVYLPEDIETVQGQNILTDEFNLGAFSFVITDADSYNILQMEENIKKIDGVNQVISIADVTDTTIPINMLPDDVKDKLYKDDRTVIVVTFKTSTSEETTINAIRELRKTVDKSSHVSGMTAMVLDTMDLSNKEVLAYIIVAVVLCSIVLLLATDSYLVPVLLLGNIGVAILYNMGTNIIFGEISYITKAISAVLQLGVTTDFSIFLYHKYEQAKEENSNKKKAMQIAISETFKSVIGSSLTTIAGFLALCSMDLTLGKDIGLVMAKGVFFGLVCVLTLFPALLLALDKYIELIVLLLLMFPAYYGNQNVNVYYKLDKSLPATLPSSIANSELKEKFNIVSPEIVLIDKNISGNELSELTNKLKGVKGVDLVLAPNSITEFGIPTSMLVEIFENDKYQLIILNSTYEVASDELSTQIDEVNKIVKSYDKRAITAGEGPLTKDLTTIADHDFKMVNYTSIIIIFVIMLIVLKSAGLPIILVSAIEFAIFVNMSIAYYTGVELPFVASIVIGTIQLGATIDYAILMSTKYLEERKKKNKFDAMKETLSKTSTSIIVSAFCFFAATFGVAMYSKIDMIASICNLLARGSIISMLY